jgi:imidazolonepropionase-like amidohydrolase
MSAGSQREKQMSMVLFRGAHVFDGHTPHLLEDHDVLVADGRIAEMSEGRLRAPDGAEIVECRGRTLMPGLIDAHVHVYASSLDLGRVGRSPPSYLAHWAARFLRDSLSRGFTTVRDVGGADVGLATAIGEGLI